MTAVAEPTKKQKKAGMEGVKLDANKAVPFPETAEDQSAPAPDPKPGEPGYDWQAEYPGEKVFTYTHDGITIGLAAISEKRQPSIGFLRRTRRQPEFEQVLDMVEFITCPEALALVDEWVPTDLIAMFEKWSEWNRTNAGE